MNNLPYIQPDKELHYNLGIVLLILKRLSVTKRGKKVLTMDKLQTFHFLVMRPAFLNKVLGLADKKLIDIDECDFYTVDTLAVNVDELFDRERLQFIIKILSSKNFIKSEYSDKEGFLFDLTDGGRSAADELSEGYFHKINTFLDKLSLLQSQSSSKLNGYINTVLQQGM